MIVGQLELALAAVFGGEAVYINAAEQAAASLIPVSAKRMEAAHKRGFVMEALARNRWFPLRPPVGLAANGEVAVAPGGFNHRCKLALYPSRHYAPAANLRAQPVPDLSFGDP